MTAFFTFLDHLSTAEWFFTAAASWCVLAALVAPRLGRAMRDEEIRQPEVRDWLCSDGFFRTEAEAADWVQATPGASAWVEGDDSTWLDPWPAGDAIPNYVPQEWSA